MKTILPRIALILTVLFLAAAPLCAQAGPGPDDPVWVEYEQGKLALSNRDYGQALFHFKQALSRARVLPEAELAVGDVYFLQGDFAVAEEQYRRAYEQRRSFIVPDMQYEVLYRLARLYFLQKRYGKMVEAYQTIIKDDALTSGAEFSKFRENLMKLFRKKGFDATFLLNRINESFAAAALSELAEYYYKTHNFTPALEPGLLGIIALVTEGMLEIREEKPDYRFTTLADFLRTGLAIGPVRDYLEERDFFRRLYYLALVCYEIVEVRDTGISLLKILAASDAAGEYQRRARDQLKKPWREPRLDAPVIQMP